MMELSCPGECSSTQETWQVCRDGGEKHENDRCRLLSQCPGHSAMQGDNGLTGLFPRSQFSDRAFVKFDFLFSKPICYTLFSSTLSLH